MHLKLKNFRCYKEHSFDFDDIGFFLISANSGKGKSSIFEAINFALYGVGDKVIKRGEKSCSVEFIFDDLKVLRTKGPNRLLVNEKYEDSVGQEIIYKKFGKSFDKVGYISQKAMNSFILMTPIEKLQFLETFAFQDVDLTDVKKRCKDLIKNRENDVLKIKSQLELAESYLKEMEVPEEVEFPINCKNKELAIKNEETKYKNCETRIKKNRYHIEKIQNEINDLRVLNTHINNKDQNIDKLISELEELSIEEQNIKYIGDELYNEYKERLRALKNKKELVQAEITLNNDKEKLERRKINELDELQKKINIFEKSLWEDGTREETIENITSTKDTLKDIKQINLLLKQVVKIDSKQIENNQEQLNNLRESLSEKEHLLEKKSRIYHECPKCNAELYLFDKKLFSVEDNDSDEEIDLDVLEDEISDIKIKIKNLEKNLNSLNNKKEQNENIQKQINDIKDLYEDELDDEETVQEYLDDLESYMKSQIRKEKDLLELKNKFDNRIFSSNIIHDEKDIKKQEEYIESLKEDCGENEETLSEEELINLINTEKNNKDIIDRIRKKRKSLQNDKLNNKLVIDDLKNKHIEKYKEIKDEDKLKKEIEEYEQNIIDNEKDKQHIRKILDKIEEYKKYIEDKNKYETYHQKIITLHQHESESLKKLISAKMLKEKILESESIAMVNIVENINNHSKIYLESFFPENPISITLKTFKESKKSDKPQINLEMYYNDEECDLKSISGGELDRVVLAFTLALSDIFNTPLLLLDESTSGLDEENTSIVFESIKENFKNKPVLVIGHQIVQGIFDKVIIL